MIEPTIIGDCTLYHGDNRDVLRQLPSDSLESCVTDPPYALVSIVRRFGGANAAPAKGNTAYMRASAGFMGKQWDTGETAFSEEFWAEVFRVLKPGAHVAAFGASRGYHRMACAIEDAGFEIRDSLMWVYGSGFVKSHSVPVAIDKAAGVAPRSKAFNMKGRGDRAEEMDSNGREFLPPYEPVTDAANQWDGWGSAIKPSFEPIVLARKPVSESSVHANVMRWGTGALNVDGCRIEANDNQLAEKYASVRNAPPRENKIYGADKRPRGEGRIVPHERGRWPANVVFDGSAESLVGLPTGASRYFYHAKANKTDRAGSKHPTVKPVALMQWIARLITPPGGTVLDPFAGSGTTGQAAIAEGFRAILCEREDEYVEDIKRRLALPVPAAVAVQPANTQATVPANDNLPSPQADLFAA